MVGWNSSRLCPRDDDRPFSCWLGRSCGWASSDHVLVLGVILVDFLSAKSVRRVVFTRVGLLYTAGRA